MLHSIVLVKQVPDTANITGKVMNDDGTVNRSKLPAVFNSEDRVALELALRVRDRFGSAGNKSTPDSVVSSRIQLSFVFRPHFN